MRGCSGRVAAVWGGKERAIEGLKTTVSSLLFKGLKYLGGLNSSSIPAGMTLASTTWRSRKVRGWCMRLMVVTGHRSVRMAAVGSREARWRIWLWRRELLVHISWWRLHRLKWAVGPAIVYDTLAVAFASKSRMLLTMRVWLHWASKVCVWCYRHRVGCNSKTTSRRFYQYTLSFYFLFLVALLMSLNSRESRLTVDAP